MLVSFGYLTCFIEIFDNRRFEASTDGIDWTCIREHTADDSLSGSGSTHTWSVSLIKDQAFSKFRFVLTGNNSSGKRYETSIFGEPRINIF